MTSCPLDSEDINRNSKLEMDKMASTDKKMYRFSGLDEVRAVLATFEGISEEMRKVRSYIHCIIETLSDCFAKNNLHSSQNYR